ncbi:MAG: Pr6Pr family membrane protein [Dokdonella sp.]
MSKASVDRWFAAVIALVAWGALVLQYGLLIDLSRNEIGLWLATLRLFSFFTILSNLLVALTTTFAVAWARSAIGEWLAQPRTRGAAALCIGITCAIYFFVLASTWAPQGAQLVADVLLHYVVPALYLFWWVICVPHRRLVWSDAVRWLLLPLAFLVWALGRGAWLHEYPYPFIDVDVLGMALVVRNAFGIGVLFFIVGLVLIAFDRSVGHGRP